tara:strand:+ start:1525 stop:2229 length:705 start_codon:yes stop_codon:yes gene_type:complete
MSTQIIKNKPSWLGDLNIGDYAHALAMDYGADAVDNTVLTDTTHSSAGGLLTFGFSVDAYADFTNADSAVFADVAQAVPLTFATSSGADDEVAYLINARQISTTPIAGAVGEMAGMNISGGAAGDLARGIIEFNSSTASSGTTTGSQLGAISAAQRIVANLHVTTAAGSSLDVIVQSDDNSGFTSPTNRITFSQATGLTSQHLSLSGAITDSHWRLSYTIAGGSFTFAVALGIA